MKESTRGSDISWLSKGLSAGWGNVTPPGHRQPSEHSREEGVRPSEAVVLTTVPPAGLQHQRRGGVLRATVWASLRPLLLFGSSQIGSLGLRNLHLGCIK